MASTDTNSTQRSAEHVSLWLGATLFVALPYIIVGVVWAGAHSEHLTNVHGLDRVFSYSASCSSGRCWWSPTSP